MSLFLLYVLLVLPSAMKILVFLGVASLVPLAIFTLPFIIDDNATPEEKTKAEKTLKKYLTIIIGLFVFAAFVPNSEQMLYIFGTYTVTNFDYTVFNQVSTLLLQEITERLNN